MTLLLSKLRTTNFYLVWTNLKRYVTLSGVEAQLTNLLQFDIFNDLYIFIRFKYPSTSIRMNYTL
ncbi:hypothetical protein SAMN04488511_109164 [Pedobacter suwonensis]|uniref:Uncharacterized protein n=1 Tax=Pedobacter suwonensis TaxID=332999 RepID=A0A1I0TG62_9SPHI|nr:hypothetical protein SAMN04488511_109164 [Pedobacter suwonensis]